jgi:hypothetical protein
MRLQNQDSAGFIAAEEAEKGMAEMSKVYDGAEGAQAPDANECSDDKPGGSSICVLGIGSRIDLDRLNAI